jgi:RNA polymerase sigma-70 factor (ECF subfamily)
MSARCCAAGRIQPGTAPWRASGAVQLRAALDELPAEQRQAIELAYFGGRTYREIATMTGVPLGTANGRLRLALARLRELLRPERRRARERHCW